MKKLSDLLNRRKKIESIVNDYLIFPVIVLILGAATIFLVVFVFPVWLIKETNSGKTK